MDIQKLKAEFEKLKYVEEKLEYLNFDEHLGCYVEKNNGMPVGLAAWVNGAFYGFEQAAKAQAVPEGFVVVPMVPSERMIKAVRQCYEGEAYLPYSLYSEFVNQAIIERMEAQEQAND
ncbi:MULTISPECIES: hypothetical protein [Acinetobacter]|uniref:hypothetical protein n=1 Tax=Acinetobacter TaxID=469 RepID=UPI00257ED52E|nr:MULTISPECIES: hypothetical protein [unclassified Acinetobacter]|tara:strand:- start:176 stop:529 length:354 start_codon:yes stop_codon:yes gene_type:complete